MKKNIRRVFWFYFLLFMGLQLYFGWFLLFGSQKIITNPNNPRIRMGEANIKQGAIKDEKGQIIAESLWTETGYQRNYPFDKIFAHILGNTNNLRTGVEAKEHFQLEALTFNTYQRLKNLLLNTPLLGNDVVLTIDADFQTFVYDTLGKKKGAIVAMEPSTGKILAMVSYPNYNPNTIDEDWDKFSSDTENAPLVNRATQGLYPPGSVFKIITALDILRNQTAAMQEVFHCTGVYEKDGVIVHCIHGKAHGDVDLEKALTVSCNCYFAHMSTSMKNQQLATTARDLYFNRDYGFLLEYGKSSFVLNDNSSIGETLQTSFGQGKTLMTPLHIALVTACIANGGIMMEPYIVDHIETPTGIQLQKHYPQKLSNPLTSQEANMLTDMMKKVVSEGTGKAGAISDIAVAGKTGTAQNEKEKDHGLFTAFAPADNPKIVVTVVLENGGGSDAAVPLAKEIVRYYLKDKE